MSDFPPKEARFLEAALKMPTDLALLRRLLDTGVDINVQGSEGYTLAETVIQDYGRMDGGHRDTSQLVPLIDLFLACGLDVNAGSLGILEPLSFCGQNEDTLTASEHILQHKPQLYRVNDEGMNIADWACAEIGFQNYIWDDDEKPGLPDFMARFVKLLSRYGAHPSKTAAILMGIQASGKSTFFRKHFDSRIFEHISLDTLHTRNREKKLLLECLDAGRSFVVDNTNPTRSDRARYIAPARERDYHVIGYFLRSCIGECFERNRRRGKKVPDTAIFCTSNKLEMPCYAEGFDELWYVSMGPRRSFVLDEWREDT